MRNWLLAALLSCAVAAAQPKPTDVFEKAPPDTDNALRESVTQFFQAHVEGKFRQAEAVIAEDSKDFFYNMEKQRYISFEIVRINYSDNFTKATVVTGVELDWRSPRIGVMRVKPPLTSLWRAEGDKWYWYVVPQKDWDTPWGKMNPGADKPDALKKMFQGVDVATVLKNVNIDNAELRLSGFQPSKAEATISNTLPGDVTLRLEAPSRAGLVAKLERETLKSGETAKVLVAYDPAHKDPKPRGEILIHVGPTGQVMRIGLTFEIQPELKKLLPPELQKK